MLPESDLISINLKVSRNFLKRLNLYAILHGDKTVVFTIQEILEIYLPADGNTLPWPKDTEDDKVGAYSTLSDGDTVRIALIVSRDLHKRIRIYQFAHGYKTIPAAVSAILERQLEKSQVFAS
jgi:hypothetical protein